ncbi:MAG: 3'-5' exonuclease [Chromatiaceae bacterium]|nr:MAG: 3'-5' exonuclease [Chromatiaceae bacterium]
MPMTAVIDQPPVAPSDPRLAAGLADYHAACASTWHGDTPVAAVRFVVLDCEATGLDVRRHRIVSIGAVAISECRIDLGDSFEALLKVRHNTAATLVHGITRNETRIGLSEPEALIGLLAYLRDGVIVGHHIRYDLSLIDAALQRHAGARLGNLALDTGDLTRLLMADGAFVERPVADLSLDGLCSHFRIVPYDRHTAAGDAFLTAQVLLRLLRIAARHGRDRLAGLLQPPPPAA